MDLTGLPSPGGSQGGDDEGGAPGGGIIGPAARGHHQPLLLAVSQTTHLGPGETLPPVHPLPHPETDSGPPHSPGPSPLSLPPSSFPPPSFPLSRPLSSFSPLSRLVLKVFLLSTYVSLVSLSCCLLIGSE